MTYSTSETMHKPLPALNEAHLYSYYLMLCQRGILWPWVRYPSCRHTTVASVLPQESSHTVPHTLFMQISTVPSFGMLPPTSRNWPAVQETAHDISERLFIEHQRSLYIWSVTAGSIYVDKCHVWKIYSRYIVCFIVSTLLQISISNCNSDMTVSK